MNRRDTGRESPSSPTAIFLQLSVAGVAATLSCSRNGVTRSSPPRTGATRANSESVRDHRSRLLRDPCCAGTR